MTDSFFRSQALDVQSRIDQLPQTMTVTSPLTRAVLALIGAGLLTATVWSAFVEVPVRVIGNGILVDASGELLRPVRAPMEGVVERLLVNEGDRVHAGQPVARLRLPERIAALEKAERHLAALLEQQQRTTGLQEAERNGDDRARQVKVQSLDRRISDLELRLSFQQEREEAQAGLLAKGATTKVLAFEARSNTHQAVDQLANARSELSALLADILVTEGRRERERLQLQLQIDQVLSEITVQKTELARGTTLLSPVDGTVGEISADRNGLVTVGQTLISIIPSHADNALEAVAYIPLSEGKLVKPGSQVLVRPGSLPWSEQGMLRAVVVEVSDAPISERALSRVLGNAGLVSQAAGGSAPFSVRIRLERDANTPSRYSWTSGEGPKVNLSTGTPISARITVERATLLSLALPALKRLLIDSDEGWTKRKS